MRHFAHRNGELWAEDVPLSRIAKEVGTPAYVYSRATLTRHYRVFADAFAGLDALVAYSVKANSNLAVLKLLGDLGAGADVVSGGELARAIAAGIPGERIVFSGVGKTRDEMRSALEADIHMFNVESREEAKALSEVASSMGAVAPIAFRVNPDVEAGGHAKITTGRRDNKFGIAWDTAREAYAEAGTLPGLRVVGVDVHIGSQIADLAPYEAAIDRVAALIRELRGDGHRIANFDLGGGLGIPYRRDGDAPPLPSDYGDMVRRKTAGLDVKLIFEPGRMIAGNAGVLLARVLYAKETTTKRFLVLDAAMNDLIRPALYDAWHEIEPVRETATRGTYDVVGPVCESGDTFAIGREMGEANEGELVVIHSAGAYGAVQASQYNSRPLVPEVMVDGDRYAVIRERPRIEDMLKLERVPDFL